MASVLVHACCGPCSTYTVKHWRGQGLGVAAFWFNPNIHPFSEHQLRLQAMQELCHKIELHLFLPPGYDMVGFLRRVVGREGERCSECFLLRLSRVARAAREEGFDAFTTTLLISPYQKHDLLREVGQKVAQQEKIAFLYEDLRRGFAESRKMSRELGLYRQQYCGCIYSEWERFARLSIPPEFGSASVGLPHPLEEG